MSLKLLLPFISATILLDANLLQAQVVEDGTLSTEVTQSSDRNYRVGGGEQRGSNLFHSFEQFSLAENGSVVFDNALEIQNIISRVTGSSISQIDGLIQNNGTANLFLLNPNGIVFGENARLNLGGSFVGTTATSLVFEDGMEFNADLNSDSLLTVSTPLGLQFGSSSGEIVNRANFAIANPLDPTGASQSQLGLVGAPETTLALFGNGIVFDGGAVTVSGGNIELGSVAANSFISLSAIPEGWKASYDRVTQFSDIKLDRLAGIDTSGEGGGSINLTGRNIEILNGSIVTSNTQGSLDGKGINVRASELLKLEGSDTTGTQVDLLLATLEIFLPRASQISSYTSGTGDGGDINLSAKNLRLLDGGSIELQTFPGGTGNGGNLAIAVAESISLDGFRPLLGVGDNAADLVLATIGLDSAIELNQASEISTATINSGKGGDIKIAAQNLRLANGSVIGVTPFASGNGGNIDLDISESLRISGASSRTSSIGSTITANTFAAGNAGSININTGRLQIEGGGQLITTTSTASDAGDINIVAESIAIQGINNLGQDPSRVSADTQSEGNGGNIFLATDKLSLADGGNLSVRGSAVGAAGSLSIDADVVELSNSAKIVAATEFRSGGNIELNIAERLTLKDNSLISARAFNDARGGNLSIDADFIIAFPQENNDILANALFGAGGNIAIETLGIFGLEERSSFPANLTNDLDASSEFGTAGIVSISFPTISQVEGQSEMPTETLDVDALLQNTFCKVRGKSRFVATGRGGIPRIPDNTLVPEHVWSDWRIVETAESVLETEAIEKPTAIAERELTPIQGWVTDAAGNIVLTDRPTIVASNQPKFNSPDCNQFKPKDKLQNGYNSLPSNR